VRLAAGRSFLKAEKNQDAAVPTVLAELCGDKDPEKSKRVIQAMLQMDKLDIKTLKQAYDRQ